MLARLLLALLLIAGLAAPAQADPADIDAAARGVVRVVVVGRDGEEIFAVSHGTGFAVSNERIVTNAHVVQQAIENERLTIGIVPSGGGEAVYARIVSVSPRNDLALLATTTPMRLPPLTIAGNPADASGTVTSIGYPMNVDQAQGLDMSDIFRAQPPVTAQGFLSGRRPSREFDTLLHTAPIARGNSGGPLVDACGRVLGVNSFGAESGGADAEFFFAVSTRELLPFLRANDISPRINSMPCRSLAELDAEERARAERAAMEAQMRDEASEAADAQARAEMRRELQFEVLDERANGMALSFLLLLVALGGGAFAWDSHRRGEMRPRAIGGSVALVALAGAVVVWLSRPAFAEIDARLEDRLREAMAREDTGTIDPPAATGGALACVLDPSRSRVTGAPVEDIALTVDGEGCVNERTQYGLGDGRITRVFVPASEEAVSVNRFDAASGEYVIERYLLDRAAMTLARSARGEYQAPACGAGEQAARELDMRQQDVLGLLPASPNERLVYDCTASPAGE